MSSIAFFDFDGTITRKDTLFEIIRFQQGTLALYTGLACLSPALLLFKLGLLSSHTAKQLAIRRFFRHTPVDTFQAGCESFCRQRLPELVRPAALTAIWEHLAQGHQVVVVTASAEDWVAPWCRTLGIGCIGTRLEVVDRQLSGNLQGANCNQEEKVLRIKEQYQLADYQEIYAYGDTEGDRAMLGIATHPFYRQFH
ncbi:HAD-IB family hydrolase [Chitinophaga pendula]|uniref:HAD-IB family hydrolase n=1 Tax=Chitinophaga TaxID=79328 RepID=UPI000BAEE63D|nr:MULTISPECIES: HAD-IB family hydrolase [Chitinophaga]ASZ12918.1 HAD-IB family hydrolase [Chitinophaga sp. MD30]UCJ09454.1 HAD-IB family hydrolase [Chitinophaga pendula]